MLVKFIRIKFHNVAIEEVGDYLPAGSFIYVEGAEDTIIMQYETFTTFYGKFFKDIQYSFHHFSNSI